MGIWCFGIVNGRLAAVFYGENKKIEAHCYVKKEDYKTKQEQKWIEKDTKRLRLVWRNKKYRVVTQKSK